MDNKELNQPIKGLNTDVHPINLDGKSAYTYALNARQESEDGGQMSLTNEPSNTIAELFPKGYKVIGRINIVEVGRTMYWLVNPETGGSEIGYIENDASKCIDTINLVDPDNTNYCAECPQNEPTEAVFGEETESTGNPCMVYVKMVNDPCLNFSYDHPIHKAEYEITNKTIRLYWTDNYNPMKWLDTNNIPYLSNGALNCNLTKVFPDFEVPTIKVVDELDTGSLKVGTYQFLVAYANSKGEELSQYYSVTNPAGVWENKIDDKPSFVTSRSIKIHIDHLDENFKYFNIAVIKTIEGVQSYDLVGTYDIINDHFEYVYTGNDKSPRELTLNEIYFRSPSYKRSGTVEAQNNILMWGNLHSKKRVNYQSVANRIKLQWETWTLPVNKFQAYNNIANTAELRGYMRDEVYAFDFVPLFKDGTMGDRFPIPGPQAGPTDWDAITNDDAVNSDVDKCKPGEDKYRWQVYNTAKEIDYSPEYVASGGDNCVDIVVPGTSVNTGTTTVTPLTGTVNQLISGVITIEKTGTISKITIDVAQPYPDDIVVELGYTVPGATPNALPQAHSYAGLFVPASIPAIPTTYSAPFKVTIPAGQTTVVSFGNMNTPAPWDYHDTYEEIYARIKCNNMDFEVYAEDNTGTLQNVSGLSYLMDDTGCQPTVTITPSAGSGAVTGTLNFVDTLNNGGGTGDPLTAVVTLNSPLTYDLTLEIGYISLNTDGNYRSRGFDIIPPANMPSNTIGYNLYPIAGFGIPGTIVIPAGQTTVTVPNFGSNSSWYILPDMDNWYTDIYIKASPCQAVNFDFTTQSLEGENQPPINVHNIGDACSSDTITVCSPNKCYIGPYKYGEFGFWQSTERYPNDPDVWGELAGQLIRHHRFPDCAISPIHDNNITGDINYEHTIFPIGVKVDEFNIMEAIKNSSLSQEEKDDIIGIKILRSYRGRNRSIVAKGMVFNVGQYEKDKQKFLYPNYPFNDLRSDPFLSATEVERTIEMVPGIPGQKEDTRLDGFNNDVSQSRYTFMSPDTSFKRKPISGKLKLETVEYGKANTHLVKVQDNAKYTIGTQKGVKMALTLAITTCMNYTIEGGFSGVGGGMNIDLSQFTNSFQVAFDLIKKLIPFREYGYAYHAVGNYSMSAPVPDNGNKIRSIELAGYLDSGIYDIGDVAPVNNYQRESSVFLKVNGDLPFSHTVAGPQDNTRYTFGSYRQETGQNLDSDVRVMRDVNAYYASIKQIRNDQYGQIYSYESIDTGSLLYFGEKFTTVFGGDIFINRFADKRKLPFFLTNTVGQQDDTDVFYNELHNVAYPIFFLSTGPVKYELTQEVKDAFDKAYKRITATDFLTGLGAAVSGGMSRFTPAMKAMFALVLDVFKFLGIKNINLDKYVDRGYFEEGVMYLFAYGIPYFFVESDVNVDYRQAENTLDKNFFPNVGTNIPDLWLQEKTVSITNDNYHSYNWDLSRNNLQNFFTHLPKDYKVNETNINHHKTRVIYSEPSNLEEKQNNWLVYKANNYKDYDLTNGELIDINALESQKFLLRFENNMAVGNAYIKLATDNKSAIIGDGNMFANPEQSYSQTDVGYAGTQHKAFCSTKYGHFWADAKRGEVFLLQNGGTPSEISRKGMRNWLKENLPFNISKYIKNVPVDNSYKDIGLCMTWDNRFERLFITKRDVLPRDKSIVYQDGQFYTTTTETVEECELINCCPEGYELINGRCVQEALTPAVLIEDSLPFEAAKKSDGNYTRWYTALYDSFNPDGTGVYTIMTDPYWQNQNGVNNNTAGPLNRTAIWNSTGDNPIGVWVGLLLRVDIPTTKTYYIGIGADDRARIILDCETILEYDLQAMANQHFPDVEANTNFNPIVNSEVSYKIWHIFPITIPQGQHFIEIQCMNTGGPAGFGVQVYENTEAEILAATQDGDLTVLLDSADYVGEVIEAHRYECPGQGCHVVVEQDGAYWCTGINELPTSCETVCKTVEKTTYHPIDISDPKYFCDSSWTLAYSPLTESWVSYYSFIPNYYVEQQNFFQSGINSGDASLWNHLLTNKGYQTFYGVFHPFDVETITKTDPQTKVLTNVSYRLDVLRYTNSYDWKLMKDVTFTEAVIHSTQQTSGNLKLNVRDKNDMSSGLLTTIDSDGINIPVSQTDDIWRFNKFSDVTRDHNSLMPVMVYGCGNVNRKVNPKAVDYNKTSNMLTRMRLRSDWFKIKLSNTQHSRYKFIFKWVMNKSINSGR